MAAGDPGITGSCPNRKESQPLNSRSASLFMQNYFPTIPVENEACKENSVGLPQMVQTCYTAAGNRIPNFIAVNYYMRSDGGGVFDVQDRINGVTLCGCNTIAACQAGAPAGACKDTGAPNRTSSSVNGNVYSGTIEFKSPASAASISNANIPSKFVGLLLLGLVLIIKPFWSFRHSFFLLMSLPRFFFVFNVSYVMGLQLQ
jgi:hypothetical protein